MGFRDKLFGHDKSKHEGVSAPAPTVPPPAPTLVQSRQPHSISQPVPKSSLVPSKDVSSIPQPTTASSNPPDAGQTAAQPAPNLALQKALEDYVATLPETERRLYLDAAKDNSSIEDLLAKVSIEDTRHEKQSILRTHSQGITQFMSVLDRFLDLSATGLSAAPQFASVAVGATRVAIKIFTGFLSYFSRLSAMFGTFADYIGSLNKWAETSIKSELVQDAVKASYIDILTFLRRARLVFVDEHGKERQFVGWRTFWRNFWKPFEDEFGSIGLDFKNHLEILKTASAAENLGATFELLKAESERRQRERKEEREDFLSWVSNHTFEDVHDRIQKKRHLGTGIWLIQDQRYQDLLAAPDSRLLWCRGKPGCGKSVLAANIIEDLTATKVASSDVGLAFAYFDYRNAETHDERKIIAAFIKQLCRKKDDIPQYYLDSKATSDSPLASLGNYEAFHHISSQYEEVYLVIDGLDECPQDGDDTQPRDEILQFISNLINDQSIIKVIVTSRPDIGIETELSDIGSTVLDIEVNNTQKDIELYVVDEVKKLRNAKRLRIQDDALADDVVQVLTSKADGMFLWVDLQIKFLCQTSRTRKDAEVRKALESLPKGLDATYARNIQQIDDGPSSMRQLAIMTLQWVLYSETTLTIAQVRHVNAFQRIDQDCTINKLDPYDSDVILEACGNLLELVKIKPNESLVRPIHYSVQEFLTKPSTTNVTDLQRQLGDFEGVHATLGLVCMRYLTWAHEQNLDKILLGSLRHSTSYLFAGYSARSFDYHVTSTNPVTQSVLNGVKALLNHSSRLRGTLLAIRLEDTSIQIAEVNILLHATRLYRLAELKHTIDDINPGPDALVLACSAGLEDAVDALLLSAVSINAESVELSKKDTPLIATIRNGHTEIVRKLLAHGADPKLSTKSSANNTLPLSLAASQGPIEIMAILIEAGADLEDSHDEFHSSLRAAVSSTNRDLSFQKVGLLFESGLLLQSGNRYHSFALADAAWNGNRKVIELLLEKGLHIDTPGGAKQTPLQALAASNRAFDAIELSRLMIEKGANINACLGSYGSPLTSATRKGDSALMRFLLDKGADINLEGGRFGSPLLAALATGRTELVNFLIDRGASLSTKAGKYGNALQATSNGDPSMLRFLIEKGADVNATGGMYQTALQYAAASGNLTNTQILLDHGADVDTQGGEYGNALMAALSSRGEDSPALICLLLDHGANPDSRNVEHLAITKAAQLGIDDVVLALVRKGANVNAEVGEHSFGQYNNALQFAIVAAHDSIVRILIEAGANVNAKGGNYGHALQAAAAEGNLSVVKLLLEHGADINARGGYYTSAVNAASRLLHPEVAEYLISKGAVPEEESESDSESSSESEGEDVQDVEHCNSSKSNS